MTGNSEFAAASEAEFFEAGMPALRHVYDIPLDQVPGHVARDSVPMPLARAAGADGHTGQQYRRSAASGSKPSRRAECPGVSGLDTFVLSAGLGRFPLPRDALFRYTIEDNLPYHNVTSLSSTHIPRGSGTNFHSGPAKT